MEELIQTYAYSQQMSYTVIIALLGLLQAVSVAMIVGIFGRESKKRKEQIDKVEVRAKIRAKESQLAMKLMSANTGLGLATAKAIKEGKANGDMEAALQEARATQREYYAFINQVAAEQFVD